MPLEDELCDILKKSRAGHGRSVSELARLTGLPEGDIAALERGEPPRDRAAVQALAGALGLRPDPLAQIALDRWEPVPQAPPAGVETVSGSVGGYGVQGYVIHDAGEALLVDTAYNAPAMIDVLERRRLRLVGICLTHGHSDHAEGIEQLLARYDVPVYLGAADVELLEWRPSDAQLKAPHEGQTITVGRCRVTCLLTPGHTPGGLCYHLADAASPWCCVGDTLFAGSIGRSNPPGLYQAHLESVRTRVLSLPSATRLLPGHGPATTVAEEVLHNPFYQAA